MNKEYPPKFKVILDLMGFTNQFDEERIDKVYHRSPSKAFKLVGLEARLFSISEYEYETEKGVNRKKITYNFVTDEIKFPYDLLCYFPEKLNVESDLYSLSLHFKSRSISGKITFSDVSSWNSAANKMYVKENDVKYFREGDKVLKGNTKILKKYNVSIEDIK